MRTTFSTLGLYMAKRFAVTILGVFFLMLLLIFFIDLIEVMRIGAGRDDVHAGTLMLISVLRVPIFSELALPFAVLIGIIGAFLGLSRSSELTIMRAAGLSVWQFLQPAVTVAFVFGVLRRRRVQPARVRREGRVRAHADRAFRCQQDLHRRQGNGLLAQAGGPGWPDDPSCKNRRQPGTYAWRRDPVAI